MQEIILFYYTTYEGLVLDGFVPMCEMKKQERMTPQEKRPS